MGMVSKHTAEVFGFVPKELKRRMVQISKRDPMWSQSRIIKEALFRFVPELEGQLGSTYEEPRRANG